MRRRVKSAGRAARHSQEPAMEKFAASVVPVADVAAWKQFCQEANDGKRADAHRDFLRQNGITAEHIVHQQTPMGDLMVLLWEGVDQDGAAQIFRGVAEEPHSPHEQYIRDEVLTRMHGIDLSHPAPPAELISTITL
jgi:hypothetical protein